MTRELEPDPDAQPLSESATATAFPRRNGKGSNHGAALSPPMVAFIAFLVIGELVAIGGALADIRLIQWLGPILAISAYILYGLGQQWHVEPASRSEFADAAYFLGFSFTLLSLLVLFGLPALTGGDRIDARAIVDRFGIALGASVIGIIARTVIEGFRSTSTDPRQTLDQAAADLAASAEAAAEQFAQLSSKLAEIRAETTAHLESLKAHHATFERTIEENEDTIDAAQTAVSTTMIEVTNATESFAEALDKHAKRLTTFASKANKSIEGAVADFAKAAAALDTIATTSENAQTFVTELHEKVDKNANQMIAGMQALTQSAQNLSTSINGLTQDAPQDAADRLKAEVERVIAELNMRMRKAIDDAALGVEGTAKGAAEDLQKSMAGALSELAAVLADIAEALERMERRPLR